MPLDVTPREMNGIYALALSARLVLGQESEGLRANVGSHRETRAQELLVGRVLKLELHNLLEACDLVAVVVENGAHQGKAAQRPALGLVNVHPFQIDS